MANSTEHSQRARTHGVHAEVTIDRVVVAHARWPMAGIASCNDRTSICRGSRVSRPLPVCLPLRSCFLSSASITPARVRALRFVL
jgi:hypothetical protein